MFFLNYVSKSGGSPTPLSSIHGEIKGVTVWVHETENNLSHCSLFLKPKSAQTYS